MSKKKTTVFLLVRDLCLMKLNEQRKFTDNREALCTLTSAHLNCFLSVGTSVTSTLNESDGKSSGRVAAT